MKQPIDYVEDLKRKFGSEYKAKQALNLGVSTLTMIKQRNLMSDETAIKIADALNLERDELLIAAAIARSEGEVKNAWLSHAKRTGIAASLAILLAAPPENAQAFDSNVSLYRKPSMYIMSNYILALLLLYFRLFSYWSQGNGRNKKTRTQAAQLVLLHAMV